MAPLKHPKFIFGTLLLVVLIVLQLRLAGMGGMLGFLIPTTLISYVFFFGFLEMLFFILVSAFLLNWQPVLGSEFLGIIAVMMLLFFVRRFIPFEAWLQNALAVAIGALIFYGSMFYGVKDNYLRITARTLLRTHAIALFEVVAVSTLLSMAIFALISFFHETEI